MTKLFAESEELNLALMDMALLRATHNPEAYLWHVQTHVANSAGSFTGAWDILDALRAIADGEMRLAGLLRR